MSVERDALKAISEMQPRVLDSLREAGVVFDRAPAQPRNKEEEWQAVAFWIYTSLCEVDLIARGALGE